MSKTKSGKYYPKDFIAQVINDYAEHVRPAKPEMFHASRGAVRSWRKIYLEQGADALRKEVRGKNKNMKIPDGTNLIFHSDQGWCERTIPFGETLYKALKAEHITQKKNELKYSEFYTIHVLKKELDEKDAEISRIIPVQKCVCSDLPRVHMLCIAENGEYTSTDSFKYCARVIHKELMLAFDYHSLRHTHATILIESGANMKDVQTSLGHCNIQTTLQTYVHDTEKMASQSVDLFEPTVNLRTS